jgi:hypothetical protein
MGELTVYGFGTGIVEGNATRLTLIWRSVDNNATLAFTNLEDRANAAEDGLAAFSSVILDSDLGAITLTPLMSGTPGNRTFEFAAMMAWTFVTNDYTGAIDILNEMLANNSDLIDNVFITPALDAWDGAIEMAMGAALNDSIYKANFMLIELDRCFENYDVVLVDVPHMDTTGNNLAVPFIDGWMTTSDFDFVPGYITLLVRHRACRGNERPGMGLAEFQPSSSPIPIPSPVRSPIPIPSPSGTVGVGR